MASKTSYPTTNLALTWIATAVCVFIVTTYFASRGMDNLERAIFLWIYNWPTYLTPIFAAITYLGSIWTACGMALSLLVKRSRLLLLFVISGMSSYLLVEGAKQAVARPRPFVLLKGITSRDPTAYGFGFPSGHVALATVLALLAHKLWPKLSLWWLVGFFGLVALSRIHLGVHAPLDIFGGASLAVIVFYGVEQLVLHGKKPAK